MTEETFIVDFLLACVLFVTALALGLARGVPLVVPLAFGLLCFSATALRRGFPLPGVARMALRGGAKIFSILRIFVLIGVLTAVWRASGTIPFFVYHGVSVIHPRFFVLFAFLLTCAVSIVLGSSLGTAGTIGVVLMVLARSGGVDATVTAGAVIAGAYWGDRCSPTSSSANLVATLTETNLYDNIRNMLRTAFLPTLLSVAAYGLLSLGHPMRGADSTILSEIATRYRLSAVVGLPALIVLALSFFRCGVRLTLLVSILSGVAIALGVQGVSPQNLALYVLKGYTLDAGGPFARIIAGGGLLSMLNVIAIVLIASSTSGIFEEAGLLRDLQAFLERLGRGAALYPTTLVTGVLTGAFGCNQTLAVILTHQLTRPLYQARSATPASSLALDLEDSAVLTAALIPWNIALAVPLVMLAAHWTSAFYAFFIYLLPLCRLLRPRTGAAPQDRREQEYTYPRDREE